MEVLGAVAAAGLFAGTAITILDAITQLRDFLRHAPARYQGWGDQLNVLADIIVSIRDNSALQTCQVSRIIESMAPKVTQLAELCAHHALEPKPRFISRLIWAWKARDNEPRILQRFQSLERDKTALILIIGAMGHAKSTEKLEQTHNMTGEADRRDAEDLVNSPEQDDTKALVSYGNKSHSAYTAPTNITMSHLFNKLKTDGNGNVIGYTHVTSPTCSTSFNDVNTSGSRNTVGVHSTDTVKAVQNSNVPDASNEDSDKKASSKKLSKKKN
ncbi:hypothetical protein F5B19DRAFT_480778 [Rostrohypoxylon terebratum]|nr:hypothetical protein F5B19DRAFT_480778 [Rostrohypoxylon terebratum]